MIDGLRRFFLGVATAPIRVYRLVLSPVLPARCKYEPSCSSYAISALRSYGLFRGSILAAWRLLRCNPLSHGGFDPVETQTLFRSRPVRIGVPASCAPEREHEHPGALV